MTKQTSKQTSFDPAKFLKGIQIDLTAIDGDNLGKAISAQLKAKQLTTVQACECYVYVIQKQNRLKYAALALIKRLICDVGEPKDIRLKHKYNALQVCPPYALERNCVKYLQEVC